jgi:hypothetical protein
MADAPKSDGHKSDEVFKSDADTAVDQNPPRELTPEAQRALAEAEARRKAAGFPLAAPPEKGGRAGPDPVRYGDWENGGIASDF